MKESIKEEIIREYGDLPLTSAPVDPENPSFDSLLGALKAVYTGEMNEEVLVKYHRELTGQLDESLHFIENMEISDETIETRDKCIGAINIVRITMDLLDDYKNNPSPEAMGQLVESLLTSRAVMKYIHKMLDGNIKMAGIRITEHGTRNEG
ncbi:MAG: hypothetical protein K8T10_01800 [Candidatus Eremiobacteraeota bacterium]|nr:hypothetical protein [Candidatus Eremiobacteraeota bacterium]